MATVLVSPSTVLLTPLLWRPLPALLSLILWLLALWLLALRLLALWLLPLRLLALWNPLPSLLWLLVLVRLRLGLSLWRVLL